MPEIGEIKKAGEIGYKSSHGDNEYIWVACLDCGKERWVKLIHREPETKRCQACHMETLHSKGKKSSNWQGGRILTGQGYIEIKLQPDDFFFSMARSNGYVKEHRLVVAKVLGRCLHLWEIVHHRRGFAKTDNRYPETLQLVTDDRHNQITLLERRISHLEKRITLLEAENELLKSSRISER